MTAPSNSFNYAGVGLKDPAEPDPVQPTVFIKFDDWETADEFEEEEDTGHVGGPTNIIAQDRSTAKAEPNFKDKLRYNEGLELLLYGLLGGDREGTSIMEGETATGLYKYAWTNANTIDLPKFTILKGFNQWTTPDGDLAAVKPILIDNQLINEIELDLNSDNDITIAPTFSGDYPLFNVPPADPTLVYKRKSSKVKANHITILMGDVDLDVDDLTQSDCIKKFNLTLNNNLENTQCFGSDFGKNQVDKTKFEGEIEVTMDMNRLNLMNKAKFATGKSDGTYATEESYLQQILVKIEGPFVLDTDLKPTSKKYELIIHLPIVNISEYTPSESGDETATVEMKGSLLPEIAGGEPLTINCKTNLASLAYSTQKYTLP